MGVILSAAGSLRWLRDVHRAAPPTTSSLAEAARWEPGVEGLTFLPYLTGERTPHANPDARGAFAGLTVAPRPRRARRARCSRAWPSGCATRSTWWWPSAARWRRAASAAAGARSDLWLRIVASVLEPPLERIAVDEGAAYGAALLGGVAGGAFAAVEEAVAACVHVRETVDPVPDWIEPYAEARERFAPFTRLWRAVRKPPPQLEVVQIIHESAPARSRPAA